jgi:hypothetical protein
VRGQKSRAKFALGSSAEEHFLDMEGVAGSIPAPPTSEISAKTVLWANWLQGFPAEKYQNET